VANGHQAVGLIETHFKAEQQLWLSDWGQCAKGVGTRTGILGPDLGLQVQELVKGPAPETGRHG
jgi:hypothetical protein